MSVKATHTLEKGAFASGSVKWVLKEVDNDQEKGKYCSSTGHGISPNRKVAVLPSTTNAKSVHRKAIIKIFV